jgi:hypothetical protein
MIQDDGGTGASQARNKLAAFLTEQGIEVSTLHGGVPEDEDFLRAIQKFAINNGANIELEGPIYGPKALAALREVLNRYKRKRA